MSPGMEPDVWRRDPSLPYQKMEEQTVVVDPRTREVHLLNETATRIWDLLAEPHTLEELLGVLGSEYDAPEPEIREQVRDFVAGMRERGLVSGAPRTDARR